MQLKRAIKLPKPRFIGHGDRSGQMDVSPFQINKYIFALSMFPPCPHETGWKEANFDEIGREGERYNLYLAPPLSSCHHDRGQMGLGL